jgi:hypothetical protein
MKRTLTHMLRGLATMALAATVGACAVEPEEAQWDDVGAFSWPQEVGRTMTYKVNSATQSSDTMIAEIRAGKDDLDGRAMPYRIHTEKSGVASSINNELNFLPTRDTLFTTRGLGDENGLKATYALVSPLERGHSWIAAYADGTDSATIRATVIERYSFWKLDGKPYENVVAVRYEAIGPRKTEEWIRFYAKGIGLILTVRNVYPKSNDWTFDSPPDERERITLIDEH